MYGFSPLPDDVRPHGVATAALVLRETVGHFLCNIVNLLCAFIFSSRGSRKTAWRSICGWCSSRDGVGHDLVSLPCTPFLLSRQPRKTAWESLCNVVSLLLRFLFSLADQERPHGGATKAGETVTALALPGRRPRPAEPPLQEDYHGVTPPAQGGYYTSLVSDLSLPREREEGGRPVTFSVTPF